MNPDLRLEGIGPKTSLVRFSISLKKKKKRKTGPKNQWNEHLLEELLILDVSYKISYNERKVHSLINSYTRCFSLQQN